MPKLLIVSRSHNPLGGADRIIGDLCRELPKRGFTTILGLTKGAVFDNPDLYRQVHGSADTVDIDGTFGTRQSRLKALSRTITQIKPHIVLSMRVFDAYEAVNVIKRKSPEALPRLAIGVRAFEAPFISDVRKYRSAIDMCVTSGNLIAQACVKLGGLESRRVVSIGGGIAPPIHPFGTRDHESPVELLYAGRLETHQKRAMDLVPFVQALSRANTPFRLHVCGSGPDEEQLRKQLEWAVLNGSVSFHGWVSQKTLYDQFYPRANAFLHFASWEGITISPREAMVHGAVPVISEFTGIHAEQQFVHRKNSLIFPVGDTDCAARHVQELASNSMLFTELSTNARSSQGGKYSFQGAIDAWSEALTFCLEYPAAIGDCPEIKETIDGRLSRLGIPSRVQILIRTMLGFPLRHASAGSEWPTASGHLTLEEKALIQDFARSADTPQL